VLLSKVKSVTGGSWTVVKGNGARQVDLGARQSFSCFTVH